MSSGLPEGVDLTNTLLILGGVGLVTLLLRALPFAAMRYFRESALVAWLGIAMPAGVMTVLVLYTLVNSTENPGGVGAAVIAVGATAALHLWRRSATMSILFGTVIYMLLVNVVF
ncbi:branched-chain amino acid ABC transporter permease [Corynebacterium sp. CNJ-954]|uniref:branched-chain amino acid transporter permease n=1 Tax=Corynebacterium sp. CNJ-954 TaxID=1904962 RepID=UPI000967CEE7|nr:AzlD domain-containing protein [Corynebacterium sp. CNJ-954]OLT55682.1 branched-chain amino acid ABC transporter permease [Corynebacterium sp. CNJ-954]